VVLHLGKSTNELDYVVAIKKLHNYVKAMAKHLDSSLEQ